MFFISGVYQHALIKMTLEEAIKHAEEKADCNSACANEHKQLAEWLKELKNARNILPRPVIRYDNGKLVKRYWASDFHAKLQEEIYEAVTAMNNWLDLDTEDGLDDPDVETAKEEFVDEVADIITVCISMLEAKGFDAEKRSEIFRRANERNKKYGYFEEAN